MTGDWNSSRTERNHRQTLALSKAGLGPEVSVTEPDLEAGSPVPRSVFCVCSLRCSREEECPVPAHHPMGLRQNSLCSEPSAQRAGVQQEVCQRRQAANSSLHFRGEAEVELIQQNCDVSPASIPGAPAVGSPLAKWVHLHCLIYST